MGADEMIAPPAYPAGLLDGKLHRYAVRAYFEDTDLSGVVYHANYLRWFERARSDFVRLLGIDQRAASAADEGAFAVTDLSIRYTAPARLDEGVMIETLCTGLGAASCRMRQRAFREDGLLLAAAELRIGFVSPKGRAQRMPLAWQSVFATILAEGTA